MNVADQRAAALAKANAVRFERARLKRDLKAGTLTANRLLDAGPVPAVMESMTVGDLLLCLPRVGRRKATLIARSTPIALDKPLGLLTGRQARALAFQLRLRCPVERGQAAEEAQAA